MFKFIVGVVALLVAGCAATEAIQEKVEGILIDNSAL